MTWICISKVRPEASRTALPDLHALAHVDAKVVELKSLREQLARAQGASAAQKSTKQKNDLKLAAQLQEQEAIAEDLRRKLQDQTTNKGQLTKTRKEWVCLQYNR